MEKIFCNARPALIIMIQSGMSATEPQLTIVALSTSTRRGKSAFFPQVKDLWKSLQIKLDKTFTFPYESISKDLWKSLNYISNLTKLELDPFQTTRSHCLRDFSKIKTSHSQNALAVTTVRPQSVVSLKNDTQCYLKLPLLWLEASHNSRILP